MDKWKTWAGIKVSIDDSARNYCWCGGEVRDYGFSSPCFLKFYASGINMEAEARAILFCYTKCFT